MPSLLLQKQWLFAEMTQSLFQKIEELGYRYTYGDAYRDPRLHGEMGVSKGYGYRNSCHKLRLAIDINLYLPDGTYLTDGAGHDTLHEYWTSIGGAKPIPGDLNHYSLEWQGYR